MLNTTGDALSCSSADSPLNDANAGNAFDQIYIGRSSHPPGGQASYLDGLAVPTLEGCATPKGSNLGYLEPKMFVDLLLLATLLMLEADALVRENGNVSFLFYSLVAASNLTLIYTETTINPSQGRLPALGWNSWNAFECDIDAVKIMVAANHMVNLGLKDVGYEYVNSMWTDAMKDETDPASR